MKVPIINKREREREERMVCDCSWECNVVDVVPYMFGVLTRLTQEKRGM